MARTLISAKKIGKEVKVSVRRDYQVVQSLLKENDARVLGQADLHSEYQVGTDKAVTS